MEADAISRADEKGDVADALHVVHNDARNSWTLVVPPEQPAAVAKDLTSLLSDGSHWWRRPAESEGTQGGASRSATRRRRSASTRSRAAMGILAGHGRTSAAAPTRLAGRGGRRRARRGHDRRRVAARRLGLAAAPARRRGLVDASQRRPFLSPGQLHIRPWRASVFGRRRVPVHRRLGWPWSGGFAVDCFVSVADAAAPIGFVRDIERRRSRRGSPAVGCARRRRTAGRNARRCAASVGSSPMELWHARGLGPALPPAGPVDALAPGAQGRGRAAGGPVSRASSPGGHHMRFNGRGAGIVPHGARTRWRRKPGVVGGRAPETGRAYRAWRGPSRNSWYP